ncbi:MAG: hypothetical protein R3E12_14330 [Candidatus Eisenbacteria bacterium]
MNVDWIVHHAREVVTLAGPARPRAGSEQGELGLIEDGAIAVRGDRIVAIGPSAEILRDHVAAPEPVSRCGRRRRLPGFVGPHTHLVFAGTRCQAEFAMRCAGAGKLPGDRRGGRRHPLERAGLPGARPTTTSCVIRRRLDRMLAFRTTTAEVKSGTVSTRTGAARAPAHRAARS